METIVAVVVEEEEEEEDQVVVMVLRKTHRDIMETSDPILVRNKNSFIRTRHKSLVSILTRYIISL